MNTFTIFILIGVIAIVLSMFLFTQYEFFASPVSCTFKTLGSYKLSTNKSLVTSSSSKGLIYIEDLTSWAKITHTDANDLTYSYTDFTPKDTNGVDVKTRINNIMKCNKIPEYGGQVGVNSKAALILCLQSNTRPGLRGPGSRVFFVKSFVPLRNVSGSNVIVGEIAGNTIATYNDAMKPVSVIQGALGTPNTTDTYTLSYTICAAKERPEGFLYTDCCSGINSSVPVTSSDMNTDDLKPCDETSKVEYTGDKSHDNTDGSRTGKHDPTCKSGKYSAVTGGECTGTYDTDTYLLVSKPGDPDCKTGKTSLQTGGKCTGTYDTVFYAKLEEKRRNPYKDASGNIYDFDPDCGKKGDVDTKTGLICTGPISKDDLSNTNSWSWFESWKRDKQKEKEEDTEKDDDDNDIPNEYSREQKYKRCGSSEEYLKPGFSECQKYYNCKKDDDDYDQYDYEGQC